MRTVLLVDDERAVRRDYRTMIRNSGIPVDIILECGNGQEALEILREHPVDVMLTDIAMPVMDGLELVKRARAMARRPEIVVISEQDEFTAAVEMLRCGARDYLLKPADRGQLTDVLRKLDEELENYVAMEAARKTVSRRRLRLFFSKEDTEDPDFAQFVEDNRENFFEGAYRVCVFENEIEIEPQSFLIFLDDLGDGKVCILEEEYFLPFLRTEAADACVGISAVYKGMEHLLEAYFEARRARQAAFCLGKRVYSEELAALQAPQALIDADAWLLEESSHSKRLHLIGTEHVSELTDEWKKLFGAAASLHIQPRQFEKEILETLEDLAAIPSIRFPDTEAFTKGSLAHMFRYGSLAVFQEEWMNWILELNRQILQAHEESTGQNRMRQAVEYVEENYRNDLNMAVVSNYISMNYSLFSYEFKRYTGSNFVNYLRDLRIRKAQELLSDTDMRVLDISMDVGYDNVKHFMKTFKTVCGVSPSEYRRMHR